MEIKDRLNIAKEYDDTPGARYDKDGDNSGEEFLNRFLLKRFNSAVSGNYILEIDLDGLWGSPSSFVSGSFGLLSIKYGKDLVLKHLVFKSSNELKKAKYLNEIKNPTAIP